MFVPLCKLLSDAPLSELYRVEGVLTTVKCDVRLTERTPERRPGSYVHIDGMIADLKNQLVRIPFLYTTFLSDDDARVERMLAQDALQLGHTIRLEGILKPSDPNHCRYLSVGGISVAQEDGTYMWKHGSLE